VAAAQRRSAAVLCLSRDPDNQYGARTVAVHFMGRRTGYPTGRELSASIVAMEQSTNPWRRVNVVVELIS
jgi:mRNA-degrading endonuclease toxin of MazEF toxin-antitoxin module